MRTSSDQPRQIVEQLPRLLGARQHRLRLGQEQATGAGQLQPPADPVEQPAAVPPPARRRRR
ncbi:hypothetical protein ACFSTI_21495 [Rhizorhabdus histidinilytica]